MTATGGGRDAPATGAERDLAAAGGECDVAVAGGGPSGAVAALVLARLGLHVRLLEASTYGGPRPGEVLPPSARAVLSRLGLGDTLEAAGATESFGNRSAWGSEEVEASSFVFDPYGSGRYVDRRRFDAQLASAAEAAGVEVARGVRVHRCAPGPVWRLETAAGTLRARAVVDATGRAGRLARALGSRRRALDHLVGVAVHYRERPNDPEAGTTLVEAVPDGWWYAAPVPGGGLVAVLMTDADLCRVRRYAERGGWRAALARTRHVRDRTAGAEPVAGPLVSPASSHRLDRAGAPAGWLAAGDAALATDPLSGGGMLRALVTGEAAGQALAHWLLGRPEPAQAYERWLDRRFADYAAERQASYALETRWPAAPFWRRRQARAAS